MKVNKIYLVYLLTLTYFLTFSFNMLILSVFLFSIILFIKNFGFKYIFILIFFGIYFSFINYQESKHFENAPGEVTHLKPSIDSFQINGDSLSFKAKSKGKYYQVFYKLKTKEEQEYFKNLSENVLLEVEATTDIAEGQRNENGFDYQKYLKTQNIYRVVNVNQIYKIKPLKTYNPFDILRSQRRKCINYINNEIPKPMNNYMSVLLFGNITKDFSEMRDIYSSLGIVHLFSLSGMHVNFFIESLRKLLLRLGFRTDQTNKFIVPLSFIYGGLTGFSISVNRSLFQKNLSNFGIKGIDNFSITVMTFMLIKPKFLLTVGGVLSFFFSFVIYILANKFKIKNPLLASFFQSFLLSTTVLPILIYYFYQFQPFSIILTTVFNILFTYLILPSLLIIFITSLLTGYNFEILNFIFIVLERIIMFVNGIFKNPIVLGKPSLFILMTMLLLLFLLFDYLPRKNTIYIIPAFFLLLLLNKWNLYGQISMIDVGQGDSIFLQNKFDRKNVLIDVGGRLDINPTEKWRERISNSNASRTVIPYIKSQGVGRIDILVLTHAHEDHMGDLLEVSKEFKIKEIWITEGALNSKALVEKLKKTKTKVKLVQTGDKINIFSSYIEVISPLKKGDGGNDDSIVLYGKLLNKYFLFTGDLEEEGEREIVNEYSKLPVDVLKAGHHGSKTSSSKQFIELIKPKYALISCGINNRYKHPNQETLEIFEKNNVEVFRTDLHGQIVLRKKGKQLNIQMMK
ncbi:DNA internalization-related competence protein ComEC/Rec2 [Floricoccus tropicus]|uniref:DNA internalization-related competence protein ComEC/Rec2 n=1 Tax=Floricoccus tropicus TaxID=1859473 RepID=A0A1E8GLR3_9LACT|nr:DNA internalization-related competence protein ComEC/Rec2 [Floricoccus tropicus]OFI49191.1 DNA internalization-related competence protein ComEC/Rec2 [Floricoccus tropicus]